jgi:hypothetical protein
METTDIGTPFITCLPVEICATGPRESPVVTTGLSARASATGAQAHQRLIVAALEHRSARVDDKGVQQIAAETRKLAERIAKIEADAAKRLLRTRVRARHRVRHDGRTSSAVSRRNTCSPRTARCGP